MQILKKQKKRPRKRKRKPRKLKRKIKKMPRKLRKREKKLLKLLDKPLKKLMRPCLLQERKEMKKWLLSTKERWKSRKPNSKNFSKTFGQPAQQEPQD